MECLDKNSDIEINKKNSEENSQSDKISNKNLLLNVNHYSSDNNLEQNSSLHSQNSDIVNKINKVQRNDKISARSKLSNISSKDTNKSKSINAQIDEKRQKINDILGGLKLKYDYQLSPYTDLKSFGDLTPGPGQYYNPEIKIGQGQNLRYNNLFKDPEYNIALKYKILKDNYYQSKIGPGTYNYNIGYEHKSYSQNPRTFFSKLERGPLFKITESVGPAYYNPGNNDNKKQKNNNIISNELRKKNKKISILKTEPFFQPNNIKILNSYNFTKTNKNSGGKISFKGHKNFSWKGISDFSGIGINYSKRENKEMIKDDKIEYKDQEINFDNQKKLGFKKEKFSKLTKKLIQKEISEFNKFNKPLIDYVRKDVVLKGNHLPGPCYYNYSNDSIEGNIKEINKKNKMNILKRWK